jgi:hypothetical protein
MNMDPLIQLKVEYEKLGQKNVKIIYIHGHDAGQQYGTSIKSKIF